MDSANIILGYRNPKIPTPAEMENEKLTINSLKNQNAMGQRQLQMQKELDGVTDPEQAIAVISKYDPIKGMEYKQKLQERTQSEAKDKRTLAVEGIGFYGKQASIIANIYDDSLKAGLTPEQAQQKVMPLFENTMSQGKQLYPDLPVSGDFDIDKIKQSAMQADDFLKQYNESKLYQRGRTDKLQDTEAEHKYQDIVRKDTQGFTITQQEKQFAQAYKMQKDSQGFTAGQNAANRGVTIRGQNMTDARAKEAAAEKEKTAGGGKLTEGMRSTGQYAERMSAAEKLLEQTTEQKPGIKESIMGVLGETPANLVRSEDRQKSLQAQRDWVRAKLRKESGAAIGVDEMKNEITTYFPQIGDDAGTVAQKKQARQQAVNGMISAAGGAYTEPNQPIKTGAPILDKNSPSAQMQPKKGTLKNGYVFLGGDPANPKSWKAK